MFDIMSSLPLELVAQVAAYPDPDNIVQSLKVRIRHFSMFSKVKPPSRQGLGLQEMAHGLLE